MKLSIITVNLNNAVGLRKTIESVVSQTFTDFEYIIIDGGSTDESVEVIKQHLDKITYWVSEPDKGIYNAMNKGIKVAKGEYLLFLNSGDILINMNSCKDVLSANKDSDIIYGNGYMCTESGNKIRIGIQGQLYNKFDLLYKNLPHQSQFIKRLLFDKYGRYDENYKLLADWNFNFYVILQKQVDVEYVNVDISLNEYFGANSNSELNLKEQKQILCEHLPQIIDPDKVGLFVDSIFNENNHILVYASLIENKYQKVLNSKAYRLGKFILEPFSKLKNI